MLAALGILNCALMPPVRAVELQARSELQLFQIKPRGRPVQSKSSFATTYNLGFRGPLSPWSKLQSFLTMNSSDNTNTLSQATNRSMSFSLLSQERTYTLSGGFDRQDYHSVFSGIALPITSGGATTNHYVNFIWQEPALPTVNLQFRQSTSQVSSGLTNSSYRTGAWLTGAYYEFSPFRLTFDRQQQAYDYSGGGGANHSRNTRSRIGLNFEQRLLDGLNFTADVARDSNSVTGSGFNTSSGGTSASFRLAATPTRSILLSADRALYSTRQSGPLFLVSGDSDTTTLDLRSEILPGLTFGATKLDSDLKSSIGRTRNRTLSASLGAALTRETFASLGWNRSSYDSTPGELTTDQKSTYLSLHTPLGFESDLNVDLGLTDSPTGPVASRYRGRYASFLIRNRTASDMSLGVGYRWSLLDTAGTLASRQSTQAVDFDMAWTPASTLGVNARASYLLTNGGTISQFISPSLDLRWEPSGQSSLILRCNFNQSRLWDPILARILGQSAKGLSARFSYRLSERSSLDVTYDYQSSSAGGLAFQRAVRVFFVTRL